MFLVLATLLFFTEAALSLYCPVWVPGVLLPHPDHCSKFISCSHGILNEMNCPEGLEFNVWLRKCVWPHESWCSRPHVPVEPEIPEHPEIIGVCIQESPERYLLPYPGRCDQFIYCIHGEAYAKKCPEGTHFNPIFMVCQNPFFAGCDSSLIISPEGSDLLCPKYPASVMLPHPYSCDKFYVCDYGVPYVFDCPEGLEYSVLRKKCVWPHESKCLRILIPLEEEANDLQSEAEKEPQNL